MESQPINSFGNWVNQIVQNNIIFKIPSYQRTYAWDKKNIEILIDDLQNNKEYFLGLFLIEIKMNSTGYEYSLIDGQQRFTTLYMLLDILNKLYPNKLFITSHNNKKEQKIPLTSFVQYKKIFRLSLQKGQNYDFFKEMLQTPLNEKISPQIGYFSQKKLKEAHIRLYELLNKKSETQIQSILNTISNSKILLHSTNNSGTAMQIFELLNDRGKQLTQLEALKSFIMHQNYFLSQKDEVVQTEFQESIQTCFTSIYQHLNEINNISRHDFDEDDILRYYYIAFENWKDKDEYTKTKDNLKAIFRKYKTPEEILTKTKQIMSAFRIMKILITNIHNNICEYPWMKNLYIVNRMASFYPLLISVYSKFPQILDKVCNYLELFSYRAYPLIERRTDAGLSTLYTLAREITYKKTISEEEIFNTLKNLIIDYTAGEKEINRFSAALDDPLFYESQNSIDTRYLLIKYENYMQVIQKQKTHGYEQRFINNLNEITAYEQRNKNSLSIEHIIAQDYVDGKKDHPQYIRTIIQGTNNIKDEPTIWWKNEKRKYNTSIFKENFLHCLGNLVISKVSANSSKGCQEPKDKEWSTYCSQQEIKEMIDINKKKRKRNFWRRQYPFTVDEILKRKQKIINFAKEYWSEENVKDIDKRDPLI